MQEHAQKLYDIIKSYKEIYKEKPFYIYYAYAFTHTSTQAQIAESKLIVLDYDLHTSFENLNSQFRNLRDNNNYVKDTLDSKQVFHCISQGIDKELDFVGNLGVKIPAQTYKIQISKSGFIDRHSIVFLTQTLYFYCYLLELKENETKIIKNDSLKDSLNSLNSFMQNIQTYTQTFIIKNNEINKK